MNAPRDDGDQTAARYAVAYLAATLTAHYSAIRRALEQARTTVTTDAPNPYAAALTALDGAVFGMSHADSTANSCARCGAPISTYTDHSDGQPQPWRHVRLTDPVADFLDADHTATREDQ